MCAILLQAACERSEVCTVPFAHGSLTAQRWAQEKHSITLEVGLPPGVQGKVFAQVQAAARSWDYPFLPRVDPVPSVRRVPQQDGRNTVTFYPPQQLCDLPSRPLGPHCFTRDWDAVTLLHTGQRSGSDQIIEVDIVVSTAMLERSDEIREVLVHELGHLYGLEHAKGCENGESIMPPQRYTRLDHPGPADLAALRRVYDQPRRKN